jgi:hypothetical protein
MVLFRIGGQGSPHCSEMRRDPSSADWNAGLGPAREIRGTIVLRSCWPHRPGSASDRGSEEDPLSALSRKVTLQGQGQGRLSASGTGSSGSSNE